MDPYLKVASDVFCKPIEKITKEERTAVKSAAFTMTYFCPENLQKPLSEMFA